MSFQPSKVNHYNSDIFIYLFIYFSKSHGGDNYSKTTKARNLKFGQIISLYINLCPCNFGGATSRGLGHMHPKLVTAKLQILENHQARNLKFEQIISLYMNLRPCNLGGAKSCVLEHMHSKLVTAKFIRWF